MATNRRTLDGAMDRRSFIGGSDTARIIMGPTRRRDSFAILPSVIWTFRD